VAPSPTVFLRYLSAFSLKRLLQHEPSKGAGWGKKKNNLPTVPEKKSYPYHTPNREV